MISHLAMQEPPREKSEFAEFYRATVAPLRRYLTRLLGNPTQAQDLAQDSYVRVYPEMQAARVRQPKAFLYTTARRLAIDQIRRRNLAPMDGVEAVVLDANPAAQPSVPDTVIARQEMERFQQAVARLPAGCRAVFTLQAIEHRTHAEIAELLGNSVSTVEKQHARALRLLRADLASQNETGGANALASNPNPRVP